MNRFFKYFGISMIYVFSFILFQFIIGVFAIIIFVVKIIFEQSSKGTGKMPTNEQLTEQVEKFINSIALWITFGSGILLIAGLMIAFMVMKRDLREEICLRKTKLRNVFVIIILAVSMNIVIEVVLEFVQKLSFMTQFNRSYDEVTKIILGNNIIVTLLIAGIFVPIFEEFLFRGIILNTLKNGMSTNLAVLVQALMFGIIHLNFIQSTYATLIGIVLGFAVVWTKSLWIPILAHIAINSSSILSGTLGESIKIEKDIQNIGFFIAIVLVIILIIALKRLNVQKENENIANDVIV